jgi:hypothetical protein
MKPRASEPVPYDRRPRRGIFLALTVLVALALSSYGRSDALVSDPIRSVFGDIAVPLPGNRWESCLSLARSVVRREPPSSIPCSDAPGRRVFVLVQQAGTRVVTSALRGTLSESVSNAARDASTRVDPSRPFYLELDIVAAVDPFSPSGPPLDPAQVGMDGFALAAGRDHVGAVLPTEVIADHDFSAGSRRALDSAAVLATMQSRAGLAKGASTDAPTYRLRMEAYAEARPGVRPARIVRGWPELSGYAAPDDLLRAVRAGAEYLARSVGDDGSFDYRYHPTDERADDAYGILRHAGATYALLEAYGELRDPRYLASAERAITFLESALTIVPSAPSAPSPRGRMAYLADNPRSEQQRVGGAGLALLALTKHAEVVETTTGLDTMRRLGRFIVHQQYPDGHFRDNDDVRREEPARAEGRKKEVIYYAGEAILGLLRLYALDPDPSWLAAAKKGADYCVQVRDADKTDRDIDHDHWLSYALDDLIRIAPSPTYAEHAFKIARSIAAEQRLSGLGPPDLSGSFHGGSSCATAVRVEAYAADIDLARRVGAPDGWLIDAATLAARFTEAQQYGDDNDAFVKDPTRAHGGVRESPFGATIRIDYVQHAMSGWLHLARVLRDGSRSPLPGP